MHYVLDKELKDAVQQAVRQHLTSFQPRPKRGRRRRKSTGKPADAKVSAAGGVAKASADIPTSTELPFSSVPQAVRDNVPDAAQVPSDAQCWKLSKGSGTLYRVVPLLDGSDVEEVYMVPVADSDIQLFNTAGPVKKDKPLQVKTLTLQINDATFDIHVIDVEKCD